MSGTLIVQSFHSFTYVRDDNETKKVRKDLVSSALSLTNDDVCYFMFPLPRRPETRRDLFSQRVTKRVEECGMYLLLLTLFIFDKRSTKPQERRHDALKHSSLGKVLALSTGWLREKSSLNISSAISSESKHSMSPSQLLTCLRPHCLRLSREEMPISPRTSLISHLWSLTRSSCYSYYSHIPALPILRKLAKSGSVEVEAGEFSIRTTPKP